jgi:hypothetical protein
LDFVAAAAAGAPPSSSTSPSSLPAPVPLGSPFFLIIDSSALRRSSFSSIAIGRELMLEK